MGIEKDKKVPEIGDTFYIEIFFLVYMPRKYKEKLLPNSFYLKRSA